MCVSFGTRANNLIIIIKMDTQTETAKETINPAKPADLIYGVDDRPPFRDAFFAALQHLLAIFVAIVTSCRFIICGRMENRS